MAKKILVDTGFWIALFNERDEHHLKAVELEGMLAPHTLLVPWPTLFEFVNTRLIRRKDHVARFKSFIRTPSTTLIDDAPYRVGSLEFTLELHNHSYSLTDHVLRSMLADSDLFIDAFMGFNPADFFDACNARGIEMLGSGD